MVYLRSARTLLLLSSIHWGCVNDGAGDDARSASPLWDGFDERAPFIPYHLRPPSGTHLQSTVRSRASNTAPSSFVVGVTQKTPTITDAANLHETHIPIPDSWSIYHDAIAS